MANGRIVVPLSTAERGALIKIAEIECRDPRDQLRFMLREEAGRRGLIDYENVRPDLKELAACKSDDTQETTRITASAPVS